MPRFSLRPYFVPWRSPCRPFRFSLSNPLRFARFFSALSRRNFQRKHGTEFQVFNGPREKSIRLGRRRWQFIPRRVTIVRVYIYLAVATEMVENCIPVDCMIFYHYPFHEVRLDYVHVTFTRNYAFHVFNCTLFLSLFFCLLVDISYTYLTWEGTKITRYVTCGTVGLIMIMWKK